MSDHEPTLDELFEDGRAIDQALRDAARDARRFHKAWAIRWRRWSRQGVWVSPRTYG